MDIHRLNDSELEAVTGGSGECTSMLCFQVGDRVSLIVYPEYGVGTVIRVYMDGTVWKCTVRFDADEIDAPEIEFIRA